MSLKKLKILISSVLISKITLIHYLLNKTRKNQKMRGVLFSEFDKDRNNINDIKKYFSHTTLINWSIYNKKEYFSRETKKHISFNRLIKFPFFYLTLNETKLYKKLKIYLEKQYTIYLKRSKCKGIIIIDEFSLPNTALTRAAKKLKIKTVGIQHGLIFTNDKSYDKNQGYIEYKRRKNKLEVVDYMLVFSNKEKKYLETDSPHVKAKVIGCVRYDKLAKPISKKTRKNILKKLKLKEKINVVWATQTHYLNMLNKKESESNCKVLFSYFHENKDKYNFIIKLHPHENQQAPTYNKWNKKYENVAKIISKEVTTIDLLKIADTLIIKHTTVGAEALLMKIPIILLELEKSVDLSIYTNEGFNMIVRNKSDLEKYLKIIQSKEGNKKIQKNIKKYINKNFVNFGNAEKETVKFLKKEFDLKK